jgi:hypothetical protein
MKTTKPLHIPAAMLSIFTEGVGPELQGTLIDAARRAVVAADGVLCVVRPFPDTAPALVRDVVIPHRDEPVDFIDGFGDFPTCLDQWGWETLVPQETSYRVKLDARRLAMIAAAMETDEIILELPVPRYPERGVTHDDFLHVLRPSPLPDGTRPYGFLLPGGGEGPLVAARVSGFQTPPPAPAAPPRLETREDLGVVLIHFPGKPSKEIRDAIKTPAMSFRWSGDKGTRQGIPPLCWYGPDNSFTRQELARLFTAPHQAAA